MSVSFTVQDDPPRRNAMRFIVDAHGFPRAWAEQIRFSFGDGTAAWGEIVRHVYREPGVYPVELVVRMADNRELRSSQVVVVDTAPESHDPLRLTLSRIPEALNGSQPFTSNNRTPDDRSDDYEEPFHLLAPTVGAAVGVTLVEHPEAKVDRSALRLTADVAIGGVAAGEDLSSRLVFDGGVPFAEWIVGAEDALPEGMITLTLSAGDHSRSLTFEATELTPELDPFDRPMIWLFRFDMDLYEVTADIDGDALVIRTATGANGLADFAEELIAIGGGTGDDGASVAYRRWVQHEIIRQTKRYYAGVPMEIYTDESRDAPDPAMFDSDGDFSMMRFGGALEDVFGRSRFAVHNETRVDDTTDRLGVGTTKLTQLVVGAPGLTERLDPIKPHTGKPVGTHPQDMLVLSAHFDRYALGNSPEANERWDHLAEAARMIGLAIASVTAHEMGHAMGLVPNGPPPQGFFGGRGDVTFIGDNSTDSHHADYPKLNLMQAGGSFLTVVLDALDYIELDDDAGLLDLFNIFMLENRLGPYSRAYFRRELTHREF